MKGKACLCQKPAWHAGEKEEKASEMKESYIREPVINAKWN